jgi:hypothetical protein
MGTLAETANVDYCLSFTDQGKKSFLRFQKTNVSLPFPFEMAAYTYYIDADMFIYTEMENGSPGNFH